MNRKEIIQLYYKSFENNDRKTLEDILAPDVVFMSSYATYKNRDEMLNAIWEDVLQNENTVQNLEIFQNGNTYMVKYKLQTSAIITMSEYIKFDHKKIVKIEVFMGTKQH